MADQTLADWRGTAGYGTLVIVSKTGLTPDLASLAKEFSGQTFTWPGEPDLVKVYLRNIKELQVETFTLQQHEFSWIPDTVTDLFIGTCSGDDCSKSQTCAKPGCVCTDGTCR
jgi:hypothetical protein